MIDPRIYLAEARACLDQVDISKATTFSRVNACRLKVMEAAEYLRRAEQEMAEAPSEDAFEPTFEVFDGGIKTPPPPSEEGGE